MSADRCIGLAGVIVGFFSIAAFYIWPNQKWIGWSALCVAIAFCVMWFILEVVHWANRRKPKAAGVGQIENSAAKAPLPVRQMDSPELQIQFDYSYQQATLFVTNNGTVAEVWASLRIDGPVNGKKQGMFARWVNTDAEKVKIAKGETRNLVLAFRRLSNSNAYMSQWETYCAGDAVHSVMPALYTNAIGNESATPDIHLYVKAFSDPDCIELPRERHIVLHANRAEELSN